MITIMILIFLIVVYLYGRFTLALIEEDNLNEDITIDDDIQYVFDYYDDKDERGNGHE